MNSGPCKTDASSLDWAKFRARVAERSSVQASCGADTCYEWETCLGIEFIIYALELNMWSANLAVLLLKAYVTQK